MGAHCVGDGGACSFLAELILMVLRHSGYRTFLNLLRVQFQLCKPLDGMMLPLQCRGRLLLLLLLLLLLSQQQKQPVSSA
jgi:hypothetical protein